MAVDEQKLRRSLHDRLEAAVGADEAALLMEYLPPVGWADIVTKRDLESFRTEFRSELKAEISSLKASLLMWMIPTMLSSVALGVTLARLT